MRFSISVLITSLLLSGALLPTAVEAQTSEPPRGSNAAVVNPLSVTPISPFNLTYLAYQGYLKDQGIPDNGALINAIADGKITAQDVMQAAVNANRLPASTLTDSGYRHDLEDQLNGLTAD